MELCAAVWVWLFVLTSIVMYIKKQISTSQRQVGKAIAYFWVLALMAFMLVLAFGQFYPEFNMSLSTDLLSTLIIYAVLFILRLTLRTNTLVLAVTLIFGIGALLLVAGVRMTNAAGLFKFVGDYDLNLGLDLITGIFAIIVLKSIKKVAPKEKAPITQAQGWGCMFLIGVLVLYGGLVAFLRLLSPDAFHMDMLAWTSVWVAVLLEYTLNRESPHYLVQVAFLFFIAVEPTWCLLQAQPQELTTSFLPNFYAECMGGAVAMFLFELESNLIDDDDDLLIERLRFSLSPSRR